MSETFASPVDICNQALVLVGAAPIISFQDDTTESILADRLYANTKRAMLREYKWIFATTREQLAQQADPPKNEWPYAYAYPDGCLRLLNVYIGDYQAHQTKRYNDLKYTIEGKSIFTWEEGQVFARFIKNVDEEVFDPSFADALSFRLAYRMAYPLQASNTLKADLFAESDNKLLEAKAANDLERPHEHFEANRLHVVRYP